MLARGIVKVIARGIARGLAIALGLWVVALAAGGEGLAPVRLTLYAAPWVVGLAATGAALALLVRDRGSAVVLGLVGGGLLAAQAGPLVRGPGGMAAEFTVLTLSNRTGNPDMAATAAFLAREAPDIAALQEVADPAALAAAMEGTVLAHHCRAESFVILSRHPVGPPLPGGTNRMLFCEVAPPGGPVVVGSLRLPRAVRSDAEQRAATRALLAWIAEADRPLILAGDFNATSLAEPLRRLGSEFLNAHDRAGRGWGFTFPTLARRSGRLGPWVRIDHILVSPGLVPISARVLDRHPPGADHFPVEAGLVRAGARP